jgi:hypothetical protein
MGECTPAPAVMPDPHGLCKKDDPSTCAQDGTCNGLGGCAKHKAGTLCKPAACSGGELIPASICNGNGTCIVGAPIPCAPSACVGAACKANCTVATSAADCAAPNNCRNIPGVGLTCGLKMPGQPCSAAAECESKFCADGVCCTTACSGKCSYCNFPDSPGKCVTVAADLPDPRAAMGITDPARVCLDLGAASCGTNGRCNGAGGCQTYSNGTVCKADSCDAATNRYSAESVCQKGICTTAAASSCAPFRCSGTRCGVTCTDNSQCQAPSTCQGGTCGKKPIAAICSTGAECESGFCAQGTCCQTACAAGCFSCAIPGSRGTCKPVAVGSRDPQGACQDQGPASCGTDGTCDGTGRCRLYGTNTTCIQGTCTAGVATLSSKCDGKGNCVGQGTETCFPYVCNPQGSCYTSCTATGGQCAAGKACDAMNSCGKNALGARCSTGSDCLSGNCVDGRCCTESSCPSCKFCGTKGTCENTKDGDPDPRGVCVMKKNDDPTSCKEDGLCDGSGGCRFYGTTTQCRFQACAADANMGLLDSFCDGRGNCDVKVQTCGNFECDPGTKLCRSTCSSDADCAGTGCDKSVTPASCGKQPLGATCTSDPECASGFCTDRVCCAERCSGPSALCRACNLGSSAGQCTFVGDGKTDDTCTDFRGGARECGNGLCRRNMAGVISCQYQDVGSECMRRCGTGMEPVNTKYFKLCNNAGNCGGMERTSPCGAYLCAPAIMSTPAQCRLTCDASNPNSCAPGYQCVATTGGSGECLLKAGAACTADSACASGNCFGLTTGGSGVCCDQSKTACGGPCKTCAGSGVCRECANGERCGCATGQACAGPGAAGTNVCKKTNGQSCTPSGMGADCLSGNCAPDGNTSGGRCCDRACNGPCESCTSGSCAAVTSGTNNNRCPAGTPVPGTPAACTTTLGCQANGTCGLPGANVQCGASTCTMEGQVQSKACGGGTCNDAAPTTCPNGTTCMNGSCLLGNGQACMNPGDCLSGVCFKVISGDPTSMGFCCDMACDVGQCKRCDLAGKVGTCSSTCTDPAKPRCQTASGSDGVCRADTGMACGATTDCLSNNTCVRANAGDASGICCSQNCATDGCLQCAASGSGCVSKCSSAQYCAAAAPGGYGACMARVAAGGVCTSTAQCETSPALSCVAETTTVSRCCATSLGCDPAKCKVCTSAGTCAGCAAGSYCMEAAPGGIGTCAAGGLDTPCAGDAQCPSGYKCDVPNAKCKALAGSDCPGGVTNCYPGMGLVCNSSMKCAAPAGAGGPCTTADDCGGLACIAAKAGGKICCSATCGSGCDVYCAVGGAACESSCSDTQYCGAGNTCMAKLGPGAPCTSSSQCGATAPTCVAAKAGGSICCAMGCNPAMCSFCAAGGATCESCAAGSEYCAPGSGTTAGMCSARQAPGTTCNAAVANQCLGTCDTTTCKGLIGQSCAGATTHCAAGLQCEGGVCRGDVNATCAGDAQCLMANYCDAGTSKCAAKLPMGAACARDEMCTSGTCPGAPSGICN